MKTCVGVLRVASFLRDVAWVRRDGSDDGDQKVHGGEAENTCVDHCALLIFFHLIFVCRPCSIKGDLAEVFGDSWM